jgi:hypothetical protein
MGFQSVIDLQLVGDYAIGLHCRPRNHRIKGERRRSFRGFTGSSPGFEVRCLVRIVDQQTKVCGDLRYTFLIAGFPIPSRNAICKLQPGRQNRT